MESEELDDSSEADQVIEEYSTTWFHDLTPRNNLSKYNTIRTIEDLLNSDTQLTWNTTYPTPFTLNPEIFDRQLDPVTALLVNKTNFNRKVETIKARYQHRKKNSKVFRKNERNNIYSAELGQLALETDPDPYFRGDYNWYYTGGNLDTLQSSQKSVILYTAGKNQDTIHVRDLDNNLKVEKSLAEGGEIFELKAYKTERKGKIFVSARQKRCITIFALKRGETCLKKLWKYIPDATETSQSIPFISGDFSKGCKNYFTIDVNGNVKMRHLRTNEIIFNKSIQTSSRAEDPSVCTQWSQLRSVDENNFLIVNRSTLKMCDSRMPEIVASEMSISRWFGNLIDGCERISCLGRSNHDGILYVGTTHKLIALDYRKIETDVQNMDDVVLCWTHHLDNAPSIIKSVGASQEVLALSSNTVGDMRLIYTDEVNDNDLNQLQSKYLPHRPFNVLESLEIANEYGKCLEMECSFLDRFNLSTCGVALINNLDRITLIHQNSFGDVFHQELREGVFDLSEEKRKNVSMEFESWLKKIDNSQKNVVRSFDATDMYNLKRIQTALKCEKLKCEATTKLEDEPAVKKRKPKWERSLEALSEYKDALASTLLSAWDIKPNIAVVDKKLPFVNDEPEKNDRVMVWLTSDVNIPEESIPNVESQESKIFDDMNITESQTQSEGLETLLPQANPLKKIRRVAKKHQQGF